MSDSYFAFGVLIGILVALVTSTSLGAGPIAASTFDVSDEGWAVVSTLGYVGAPTWSASGGNRGGFIYAVDPDTGAFGFAAPSKFLGDVSTAYGQEFCFDIAAYDTPDAETGWVGLAGGGYEFICHFPAPGRCIPGGTAGAS